MGSTEKHRGMIRMLQHSILQLCNEHVGYSQKLQILGVLCMTIDDEQQEVVIKVNNTLKRVPSANPGRDGPTPITPAPAQITPTHSQISPARYPFGTAITQGSPQPISAQTFSQFAKPMFSGNGAPFAAVSTTPVAPAFIVSPSGLITQPTGFMNPFSFNMTQENNNTIKHNKENIAVHQQRVSTTVNVVSSQDKVTDLDASPIAQDCAPPSATTPPSASKKSVGRKARKPMRVDCVYDEGDLIMDDENDVMTVIPTAPDQNDEDEIRSLGDASESPTKSHQQHNDTMSSSRTPSESPSQISIMRQVLEKGAAEVMALNNSEDMTFSANDTNSSPDSIFKLRPYVPSMTQPMTSRGTGSASIRALLQAQAHMRQQAKLQASMTQSPLKDGSTPPRSNTSSPYAIRSIMPILVTPESPKVNHTNGPPMNGDESLCENEQSEALDFSTDKEGGANMNQSDDEDDGIEVVRSGDDSLAHHRADSSLIKVKEENKDESPRSASNITNEDFSQSFALSGANAVNHSMPTVNHAAFPNPFATYAFVEGLQGLPQMNYAGLNLSMASAFNLSNPNAAEPGMSIQYTPTGPITVGANGQNLSNPSRVKDIIMFNDQSPLKKQKGNKLVREGDYMLDQMGEDLRKRRRRSPNETLTAEEIAEYMGASNVPSGRDGGVMFKCKYCNEEIEDLVRYLQHTLTVHNAYICHQCGKSFTTKSSLLRHRPIHTGLRRFACSICKKSFYRKDKCKSHIKRHLPANEQNVDQYQHIEPVPEMTAGMII